MSYDYTPPTEDVFKEMKFKAISIWEKYDDTYGYATKKIARVNALNNIGDNAMIFFRMFDLENQKKFLTGLSKDTLFYIFNHQ